LGHQFELDSFLHSIHSPFYWRILKRTILYSDFNNSLKICETRKLDSIHELNR